MYEDAFERYLIEKEENGKVALQCEAGKPMFQSDDVDIKELAGKRATRKIEKVERVSTGVIVKSAMNKSPAKSSSTKRWSTTNAIGFGVKAVLKEKPKVIDGRQKSISKRTDRLSGVEIIADSNVINGSRNFNFDGEMEEQITAKTKSEDEQFKEMTDRCIERWDIGKNKKVAEMRSKALEEIANSELEDGAVFSDDDCSDDNSLFDSNSETFEANTKNKITVEAKLRFGKKTLLMKQTKIKTRNQTLPWLLEAARIL